MRENVLRWRITRRLTVKNSFIGPPNDGGAKALNLLHSIGMLRIEISRA